MLELNLLLSSLCLMAPPEPGVAPAADSSSATPAAPAEASAAPAASADPSAAALEPAARPPEAAAPPADSAGAAGSTATGPGVEPGPAPSSTAPPATQPAVGPAPLPAAGGPPHPPPPTAPQPQASAQREAKPKTYPLIPIRWRAEVAIGGGTDNFFDPAIKGVSGAGRYSRFDLTARGDFRLGEGRFFLGGVAGYRGYTTDTGNIYDVANVELELKEPYFAARFSFMAVEGVDVYVEAGGGPSIVDYDVDTSQSNTDETVSGYAMGQAGLLLYLPKKWLVRRGSSRVTVGLELGVGGTYRPDLRIAPARDTPDDPIDTGKLDLGSVNLSGVTWRGGLFVRFM